MCIRDRGNIVTRFLRSLTGRNSEKSLEGKVEAYARYMEMNTETIKNLLEDIDVLTDGVLRLTNVVLEMQERILALESKTSGGS